MPFAPESKLSAKNFQKSVNKYRYFCRKTSWNTTFDHKDVAFLDQSTTVAAIHATTDPSSDSLHGQIQSLVPPTEDDMQIAVPTLSIHALRAVTKLHCWLVPVPGETISAKFCVRAQIFFSLNKRAITRDRPLGVSFYI